MNTLTGFSAKVLTEAANCGRDSSGKQSLQRIARPEVRGSRSNISNLTYDYGTTTTQSNKLLKVTDAGDITKGFKDGNVSGNDYSYDVNGNLTYDKNKGISGASGNVIAYNFMNLPEKVQKSSTQIIQYIYDAAGTKLTQLLTDGSTKKRTDYVGEYIYENDTLQFINHEEGRIIPGTHPEYQYHLKDHLGNVRMTFTTKPQTETYTATFETANATAEGAEFSPSYSHATIINSSLYNHTTSGSKSQRLSAATSNEIVGLSRSLSVMPGDTIYMEAFGKYYTPTNTNSGISISGLVASVASAFGVSPASTGEALKAYNSINNMFTINGAMIGSGEWEDDNAPKAYLNFILFDKDFVPYDMGWDQIDAGALETGTNVLHDTLQLFAAVQKAGYIYIYLSNENNKLVDVYFDDLTIQHALGPVVQQDDYYAFGLNFNSQQRERAEKNNYTYNGKELQDELDLGWMDYGARMYIPEIGRWGVIDPLAEKFQDWSPFNYVYNNAINVIDPDGNSGEPIIDKKNKTITVNMVYVFYGSGANKDNSKQAAATISNKWNAKAGKDGWSDAGDGWKIKVQAIGLNVRESEAQDMAKDNAGNALFNFIRVENQNNAQGVEDETTGETDHNVSFQDGNSGFWTTNDMKDTTPAHEAGHGLNISNPWHIGADGLMTPATDQRAVSESNLVDLRINALDAKDKSSPFDKLLNRKRGNLGSTQTVIYDEEGRSKN